MKFETSWGGWPKNFQKHLGGESFWKNGVQLVDPRGYFWGQISKVIFFWEKFTGIFLQKFFPKGFPLFFEKKFQGIFLQKNFVQRFPCKFTPWLVLHVLHFIGDFFYKTRTSLARAAFYRGFLYKTRPSLACAAFYRDFLYN